MSNTSSQQKFSSFLEVVQETNNYPYPTHKPYKQGHWLLRLNSNSNSIIGILELRVVELLKNFKLSNVGNVKEVEGFAEPIFHFSNDELKEENKFVTFNEFYDNYEKRTQIVKAILTYWRDNNLHESLKGWRNELYPVIPYTGSVKEIVFEIERVGSFLFGTSSFGVHLNGYTFVDGEMKMWIARRSPTKQTWPGMLDNMVAGGIAIGEKVSTTVIRECEEEASIKYDISSKAKSCGSLTYITHSEYGIAPETQYIYDLELTPNFVPTPNDGEVGGFQLASIEELKEYLLNGEFKPNCGLIVIDFLIRYGYIKPDDDEAQFRDILLNIHRAFEFNFE